MPSSRHNSGQLFKYSESRYRRLAIFSLIVFTLITFFVFATTSLWVDETGVVLAESWENETLTKYMLTITFFGNYQFLVPANILLLLFFLQKQQKQTALIVLIISTTSLGLKLLLKEVFHRPRPSSALVEGIKNFSYPSGHAMMSVAFYGLLILLVLASEINKKWKQGLCVFLTLLILLIGLSRIYLRVHYVTDVISGYAFEIGWMSLIFLVFLKKTIADKQSDELLQKR